MWVKGKRPPVNLGTIVPLILIIGTAVLITMLIGSDSQRNSQLRSIETRYIGLDKLFTDWTTAFNNKDLPGTMSLFATDCIAANPGEKARHYNDIESSFKKIFASDKRYKYSYKIKAIYSSERQATVRITWYLTIFDGSKIVSMAEEQGMDVLQKNDDHWQIVNFIAYSENEKSATLPAHK